MKGTSPYIRIISFLIIEFILMELLIPGEGWAIVKHPVLWIWVSVFFLFFVAVEACLSAVHSALLKLLPPEIKERHLAEKVKRQSRPAAWLKTVYLKLTDSKPLEEEADIVLDHNYDGIRELDNNLPPWWLYSFYATIIFSAIYLLRFHVFNGYSQIEEYQLETAQAKIAVEAYKKTAKNMVDVNTVTLLTDAEDLKSGKTIFMERCVACHNTDGGGGIGPNLTDQYWILGGGIKNVFSTILKGGRPGKGMISWKSELKPLEMAQVASYIITLGGTTPANPKKAEGELWVEPDTLGTKSIP